MASTITIGSIIKIEISGEIKELQIVGSADVDPTNGKISYLSPIGEALLGRKAGEQFEINLPNGKNVSCQIIEIK